MFIVVDVARKTIRVGTSPSISCEGWSYLCRLRAFKKLIYDTNSKKGSAHWINTALSPMDLSNSVYSEFVEQLVANTLKYIPQPSNTIAFSAYKEKLKRH